MPNNTFALSKKKQTEASEIKAGHMNLFINK